MTLEVEREDGLTAVGSCRDCWRVPVRFEFVLTKSVSGSASFWRARTARKDMAISHFAEIKGVVGCLYHLRLAFKVRELVTFGN